MKKSSACWAEAHSNHSHPLYILSKKPCVLSYLNLFNERQVSLLLYSRLNKYSHMHIIERRQERVFMCQVYYILRVPNKLYNSKSTATKSYIFLLISFILVFRHMVVCSNIHDFVTLIFLSFSISSFHHAKIYVTRDYIFLFSISHSMPLWCRIHCYPTIIYLPRSVLLFTTTENVQVPWNACVII